MVGPIESTIADDVGERVTRLVLLLGCVFLAVALLAVAVSMVWPAGWGPFLLLAVGCAGLAAILLLEYRRRAGAARMP